MTSRRLASRRARQILLGTLAMPLSGIGFAQTGSDHVSAGMQATQGSGKAETTSHTPVHTGDIVVTAQRRSQRILEVPVAVSAFTASALEERNITRFDDLRAIVPNVTITTSGFNGIKSVSIRGTSTYNTGVFFDPAVGIYVDGVYVSKNVGNSFDIGDLERMEVLRGPQGTLYGRNTLAGAINIITKKPTGEPGGSGKIGFGNYGALAMRASVDLPRWGPFSLRISGVHQEHDGYVRVQDNALPVTLARPRTRDRLDAMNSDSFRVALRFQPASEVDVNYTYDWSDAGGVGQAAQLTRIAAGSIFDPASPAYIGGRLPSGVYAGLPANLYVVPDKRSSTVILDGGYKNQRSFERNRVQAHALNASFDLGGATLRSITGYRDASYGRSGDLDGTPLALAAGDSFGKVKSFSQELQIVGATGPLRYTAGLYYFWDSARTSQPLLLFGGRTSQIADVGSRTEAFAGYAQLEYDFAPQLTLIGGMRYGVETKEGERMQTVNGAVTIPAGTGGKKTFRKATPAITLQYKPTEDINLFAKFARGFKSGGFNLAAPTIAESERPFLPESVDSYEIGAKARLGRWGQVSLGLFREVHKDLQLAVFAPEAGTSSQVVRNAGRSVVQGIEGEIQLRPAPWLELRGSAGLLDTKYKTFIDGNVNVADDRAFPLAPRFTAAAGLDATLAETRVGRLRLGIDYSHSDSFDIFAYSKTISPDKGQNASSTRADAFNIVDARLELVDIPLGGKTLELRAYVKNVFNDGYRISGIDYGPNFGGLVISYYGPPRTYGAELGFRW